MEQNYYSTKAPTTASQLTSSGGASWSTPNNILLDDVTSSSLAYFSGGDSGASISGADFDFQKLPPSAVIDGIEVNIDGSQTGCYGSVALDGIASAVSKDIGTLSGTYGGSTDLWGLDSIDPADIVGIGVTVDTGDISGGDGVASIDYLTITVYWHIDLQSAPSDVPTRFAYKVYSRDGNFLGELPKVTSKFGFTQDINSAGSSIVIVCGKFVKNETIVAPLLTEDGEQITTEDDRPISTTYTDLLFLRGDSPDEAIFKNSNRIKVWMYNKYYPSGKLVFSGQINRIGLKYGGQDASVRLTVYSDGIDLNNYVARGYPFIYTTDASQLTTNAGYFNVYQGPIGALTAGEFNRYGQTFKTGASVTNIGAIVVLLQGTATVTISLYDSVNGTLLGSSTKAVANGSFAEVQFEFPQLIPVESSTEYYFEISVSSGQQISSKYSNFPGPYPDGEAYYYYFRVPSSGSRTAFPPDLYFITKYGTPTTTTTYSNDDPVSEMASGILADYNNRGGLIRERDFVATGLSLTYTFVVAFVHDAIKKILELCPTGYYADIDLGTAEIDIKPVNTVADYTVVRGRQIQELSLDLTIENVKNYLLLTGGDIGGGVNLFRDYTDSQSLSFYGVRTAPRSDNRLTLTATADALGQTFIEENSQEAQETQLVVTNEHMDITLLTNGKTIGFRNFGNLIDELVLQIVRRQPNYSDGYVVLTLGRLPVRTNDEVERIKRDLMNQQTINNPTAPS